jgi:glyoxylate reductase
MWPTAEKGSLVTADRHRVFVTWAFVEPGPTMVAEACDATFWRGVLPMPRDEFLKGLVNAEGIWIMNQTERMDREAYDAAPHLRVISDFGVGYDNVDVALATERGIMVCNTPGAVVECTADHAFALLLAVARRIPKGQKDVKEGLWRTWLTQSIMGQELHGATLGIVGLGAIGAAVARRAKGFSMRVLYTSRTRKPHLEGELGVEWMPLDDLLRQSDYVSIHTALTADTRGMIGARELALMKKTAILVNTARGPIVNQQAIYESLRDGVIAGAGLDVTDPEPFPTDHPLLDLEQAIVLPHTATAGLRTRSLMGRMAATNLIEGVAGRRPPHLVNPEVWEKR